VLTVCRPTIPVEPYLPRMVVNQRCGWGYATPFTEVSDPITGAASAFSAARVGAEESTIGKPTRPGSEAIAEVTRSWWRRPTRERHFHPGPPASTHLVGVAGLPTQPTWDWQPTESGRCAGRGRAPFLPRRGSRGRGDRRSTGALAGADRIFIEPAPDRRGRALREPRSIICRCSSVRVRRLIDRLLRRPTRRQLPSSVLRALDREASSPTATIPAEVSRRAAISKSLCQSTA
jgi:hypothetical protein